MKFTRREILRWAALGGAMWLVEGCAPQATPPAPGSPDAGAPSVSPMPQHVILSQDDMLPQAVSITPNRLFYIVAYGYADHRVNMDTWRFELTGLVERPLLMTLDDIKALPSVKFMRTLECISNPVGGNLISNAWWEGVSMARLLDLAGVKPGAIELKVNADDKYNTAIPLDLARDPHAYLVYAMNDEPLPFEHGFPLRVLWPGRYGMKQPKWVTQIEVINDTYLGYWEKQGWTNEAFIKPNSQILAPADGAQVGPGMVTISGTAFADRSGVAKVEVSVDDGQTWAEAALVQGPQPFRPYVWTEWQAVWKPTVAGRTTLAVRVTDGNGQVQQRRGFSLLSGTFPDGTDSIHSIPVTVVGV
jgi:DMSO/TMAO reductase YedYZ molybdopterin-dependent catalytic subunit